MLSFQLNAAMAERDGAALPSLAAALAAWLPLLTAWQVCHAVHPNVTLLVAADGRSVRPTAYSLFSLSYTQTRARTSAGRVAL